jgi:hypothetical protein
LGEIAEHIDSLSTLTIIIFTILAVCVSAIAFVNVFQGFAYEDEIILKSGVMKFVVAMVMAGMSSVLNISASSTHDAAQHILDPVVIKQNQDLNDTFNSQDEFLANQAKGSGGLIEKLKPLGFLSTGVVVGDFYEIKHESGETKFVTREDIFRMLKSAEPS